MIGGSLGQQVDQSREHFLRMTATITARPLHSLRGLHLSVCLPGDV
uniref:Uncharacterized protein n=1 Tax=Setaria digitata TaxID=48799 RepID=A0A915PTS1_9BILA